MSESVCQLLRQWDYNPKTVGLDRAEHLSNIQVAAQQGGLTTTEKVVIAIALMFAISLVIVGILSRAQQISCSTLIKRVGPAGQAALFCSATTIAAIAAAYVLQKTHKTLPAVEKMGLTDGKNTLLFMGENFDAKQADRPNLFITDGKGKFAYMGREIEATRNEILPFEDGWGIEQYIHEGKLILSRGKFWIMKMQMPPYWQTNFKALSQI